MDYITISTVGNAADFGDSTQARRLMGGTSDGSRGVWMGGFPATDIIDYITISTTGAGADFEDLTAARGMTGACSGD